MKTTTSLQLTFKSSKSKSKNLVITNPVENLDEATVKTAMQKIIDADAFTKDNEQLYHTIDHANYIERTVKEVIKAAQ